MIFLLFVFFLIASAFLANKLLIAFLSPDVFVALRMGISGILLLLFYARKKKNWIDAKKYFFTLCTIAIFTTFFPSLLRAYALQFISASRASFWGALEPFISAFYLKILYEQKVTFNQIIGIVLGSVASLFFIFSQSNGSLFAQSLFCLADVAQISALAISRFGWIKGQELMKKEVFLPQQLNGFCFTISACISLCIVLLRGFSFSSLACLFYEKQFIYPFMYTVFVGNMLAYSLYAYALKHTLITYVSIVGLSVPLFVHILSFFLFGEAISYSFFVSLLLLGFALSIFQKK
jgi:drug/metabolite transporter (DMT)-like permease